MFALRLLALAVSASDAAPLAIHRFGARHASVVWHDQERQTTALANNSVPDLKIMHITDLHMSLDDDEPPLTSRMFRAFHDTSDCVSKEATSPQLEFVRLLQKAKAEKVDLIALGGDIVNFPSERSVAWILERLRHDAAGIPFIYTAGNHDWHLEGDDSPAYDSGRLVALQGALAPLFEASLTAPKSFLQRGRGAATSGGTALGRLYGSTRLKGVDVIFVDNSNYQVNEEQLAFARKRLEAKTSGPLVMLMHMPLQLPEVDLEPKYVCGSPDWGAGNDENFAVEGRARWPEAGNANSTLAFIDLVQQHSSPQGRLAALLTGHVHRDFTDDLAEGTPSPYAANLTALACSRQNSPQGCSMSLLSADSRSPTKGEVHIAEARGALQYSTLDAAEGGYRLLTLSRSSV